MKASAEKVTKIVMANGTTHRPCETDAVEGFMDSQPFISIKSEDGETVYLNRRHIAEITTNTGGLDDGFVCQTV